MFYGEIIIKQCLSYISFCPIKIIYNSKFILMATSLGTYLVVVMRVHGIYLFIHLFHAKLLPNEETIEAVDLFTRRA